MQKEIPEYLESVRTAALRALGKLKPADGQTRAPKDLLFTAKRTNAGRSLPPYYLVYFLLVDLLKFRNLGRFEKVAWSVPVDLDGEAFLIEHRKFGLGIFASDGPEVEAKAAEVVSLIKKSVKVSRPYFEWRAKEAAASSQLNVTNRSYELFAQYNYFLQEYQAKTKEADKRRKEKIVKKHRSGGETWTFPASALRREANFLALAAIEAFFSWTEHVFIHIAILRGLVTTGKDVEALATKQWADKFKAALDLSNSSTKSHYDELTLLRRKVRNFIAHGSFGKDGEALSFHSGAGAVPLRLPDRTEASSRHIFSFAEGIEFREEEALDLIQRFIIHLWSGDLEPAKIYIQDYGLPLILTYVADGSYKQAMASVKQMEDFADRLTYEFDRDANMDF
ncbi:hypothetical protein KKP04_11105 [Rhodomicrobium sp. Az07]|uniref:hypothetical protein n=1 Tax=Rhodomicrobium sp. Az07 TaxID=2839034 RepID=UPI001BEB047F|nr:hypothetical protein [Rhodomicrobium sp. Az07]MBT3071411.1 hypothetical protein [Rhodomicrobium sp. Az07]